MILIHRSLKRSEDYMRSLKSIFEVNCKTIDGVFECFNNIKNQGFILKIFESFYERKDLAIWIFESKDKKIKVGYSTLSNVDESNCWIDENQVNFKIYPIVTEIKREIMADILESVKKYYNLNEVIEIPETFKI